MNLIICGYSGFMGREVAAAAKDDDAVNVVAGVCKSGIAEKLAQSVQIFQSFKDITNQNKCSQINADCIIDFSHPDTTQDMLEFATANKIPVVIATTGQIEKQMNLINEASKTIPVFFAHNYSIGITLLVRQAKQIAKTYAGLADIEIVEVHHNRKLDSPSGTALTIANAMAKEINGSKIVCGRSGNSPRQENEITISSVRMGNICGIHEVHVCTNEECITLKHEAFSRAVFAKGALEAAKFLVKQSSGLYGMDDLIS